MSPKRGDEVAPPPRKGEYHVKYDSSAAMNGWLELCRQYPEATYKAWELMRTAPASNPDDRHEQLKYDLAWIVRGKDTLPQWQIEVTSGSRVWYLFDEERSTCWIRYAGTGHPKATD